MAEYTISIAETNGFVSDVIRYIRDGFVVVPVKQDKRPGGPNHGKDWQNLRITEDEPDAFWPEYPGVGWNAKASGLVIIDNDSEAARTLCRFVMEPRFGETLMSGRPSSRRNKYYYYCEWTAKPLKYYTGSYYHKDTDAPTRKKTPPLVELLTGNKQANVPPSPHPSGETLEWEGGYNPAKIVRVEEAEMLQAMKILGTAALLLDVMPGSGRRDIAFALAGFLLRNDRCTYEEVEEIFTLVWKYGLRSAEGLDDALSILERTNTKLEAGDEDVSGGPTLDEKAPEPLTKALLAIWGKKVGRPRTRVAPEDIPGEDDLAGRFIERYPELKVWDDRKDPMWVRYESGIWRVVTNNEVDLKVSTVLEAAKDEGVKPSTRLRAAVRNYAAPKVSIHADLFNANEDIYVFRNVVFNTAERREYPHSPEFYSTIQLPYDFDANATCPTWVRVMEDLDRRVGYELSAFLQEIMGYTLTSVRTAQRTFWFQGLPGGGKTTFLEGVRAAFGKYTGTLTAKNLDSDFGLMDIPGKRALVCPEVNAKFLESTETLNSLVDGGQYEIQRKFKDALEFYNRAVILWAMNRIPRIDSPENGIFRRALLIKMPAIPLGEQEAWIIPAVRGEGAGIFQWALQGLDRYLENGGFTISEQVNMDTEAWINSNDPIRRFLNEWYTTGTDTDRREWVPVADLYRHYKVWAASESAHPIRKLKFNEDLRERFGLTEYRKEDRWWRGLVMTEYGRAQLDRESDFVRL